MDNNVYELLSGRADKRTIAALDIDLNIDLLRLFGVDARSHRRYSLGGFDPEVAGGAISSSDA
jgi:hypothetical protein